MVYAVMLAKKFNPDRHDPTDWLMSEKLDGVRAYWDGEKFWSRGGKIYNAPEFFTRDLPSDIHLDGEIWLERGKFDKASGLVRRHNEVDGWRDLTFLVFDAPEADGGFENRIDEAMAWVSSLDYARVVDQEVCEGMEHLQDKMNKILKLGGEGVMLRESGSPYVRNRSGHLLKVKKFHDAEAMVVGYQPGEGRHEGRLGALIVYWIPYPKEPKLTTQFKIGTGFSDEERENPPEIGQTVKFSYQEITKDGIPRFPAYLGTVE